MSEIGGIGAGRAANGGARQQGPIAVQTSPAQVSRAAVIPPTEIMRRREERAKAQQERAQASSEEAHNQLQTEWAAYDANAAGVAPLSFQGQPIIPPSQSAQTAHRRTQSAATQPTNLGAGRPPAAPTYPRPMDQAPQAGAQSTTGGANQMPSIAAPLAPSTTTAQTQGQNRRTSTQGSRQARPVAAGPSGTQRASQSTQANRAAANAALSAQGPQENVEMPGERDRVPQDSRVASGTTTGSTARRGDGTVSSFPHAFERWEMLSSKWEGMTSHWISRLQMNSEELQNQPMLAQLSRQVTDLSAAGANLFTALVELQRLRASSERKFQRWFNDTKHDMERQQELVGQLERAVIQERRDRADDQAHWEKQVENARRVEINFSRLNAEKDRELQIAKDESRRAWEELGRYEAIDRERQKHLAQGLPVEINGYQVFPRLFPESQQGSFSQRPSTQGNTRPSSRPGPRTASPVQEDPFVADAGAADTMHEQQSRASMSSPGRTMPVPAGSSSQTTATSFAVPPAHAPAAYGSPRYGSTAGGYTSFSSPPNMPTSQSGLYAQQNTHLGYNPDDLNDDNEYELDEHGRIVVDNQGRPVSYRRGLHEARSSESEGENAPFASFGHGHIPGTSAQAMAAAQNTAAGASMQTRPENNMDFFQDDEEDDGQDGPEYVQYHRMSSPEEESQHYHPTRLSDIHEEDELSRASEAGASRAYSGAPF